MRVLLRLATGTGDLSSHRSVTRALKAYGVALTIATASFADGACGDSSASSGTTGGDTGGGGGAGAGVALKVLDWNTHNFFNDKKDSNLSLETVVSNAEYQKHLIDVAAVVGALDPDIAVFAEVENQSVLDALNTKLGDKYPTRSIIDANDPRGIDVAAISKFPFTSVVSHKADSFTLHGQPAPKYQFARDCVEYHFTKGGRNIVVLGVHFRSKVAPDDANKRLAEGQHARDIANSLTMADPMALVIVTGDFNDLPTSEVFKAVTGAAPDLYTDAASFIPNAYSFTFQGSQELIDHQMSNPAMTMLLDQSTVVLRHGADIDAASDHAPMMATYSIH